MASPTSQPINGKQFYDSSQKYLDNPHASLHTHLTENHDSHLVQDITPQNIQNHPYTHAGEAHFSPGVASVNVAATSARPNGTTENDWAEKHQHQTVLQQHCSYWDKDNDGVIWPLDTYRGCRAWGWNPALCLLVVLIINGGLSYPTVSGWLPDPFFRIFLLRVHRDKHGSDSLTYDNQGRFKSQNFEEFFSNYDRGNKGGLSAGDLFNAWTGQRLVFDLFGWSAFFFEWFAMYLLIWPANGIMRKEEIRMSYDGSLFQKKADDYAEKQKREKYGAPKYQAKSGPPRIE